MAKRLPSFRFQITGLGFGYLILTLAVGYQSILSGNNALFLIFASLLAAVISLAWFTIRMPARLGFVRRAPGAGYSGEPFQYVLEVHNRRKLFSAFLLEIFDHQGPSAVGAGVLLAVLPPGKKVELACAVSSPARGLLGLGPVEVRCRLPFSLFKCSRTYRVADEALIYPRRWLGEDGIEIQALAAAEGGPKSSHPGRMDLAEFAGLREFIPGDSPRLIHWKRSSQLPGQILVRQYDHGADRRVVLILDSYFDPQAEFAYAEAFEDNLGCTLVLARQLLASHCQVMVVFQDRNPCQVELSADVRCLDHLRRRFALLQPTPGDGLGNLLTRFADGGSNILVVIALPRGGDAQWTTARQVIFLTPEKLRRFLRPAVGQVLKSEDRAGAVRDSTGTNPLPRSPGHSDPIPTHAER